MDGIKIVTIGGGTHYHGKYTNLSWDKDSIS